MDLTPFDLLIIAFATCFCTDVTSHTGIPAKELISLRVTYQTRTTVYLLIEGKEWYQKIPPISPITKNRRESTSF